jgi:hypothetical protein
LQADPLPPQPQRALLPLLPQVRDHYIPVV